MSLERDTIIVEVMAETKRTDKKSFLQDVFPDVLFDMSVAVTEEGKTIPLQDLKIEGELSITDGDIYVDLPTGFVFQYAEPELLYDTDKGRQLIKKSLDWMNWNYANRANNDSNKSKPSYYCLEKNRFDFAPMSDDSYTITFPYHRLHPTVDDNSDTILFRDQFKDVIKNLLKSKLWELFDDFEKRDYHYAKGVSLLRALSVIEGRNSEAGLITNYSDV